MQRAITTFFSFLIFIVALVLLYGGFELARLGGSTYYIIAGVAYLLLSVLFLFRKKIGIFLSLTIFTTTCIWAFYEAGNNYWQLIPRLITPALIFTASLWIGSRFNTSAGLKRVMNYSGFIMLTALVVTFISAFYPHGTIYDPDAFVSNTTSYDEHGKASKNWEFFGRSSSGTRFSPAKQITPENVKDLQVAWSYRTGRRTHGSAIGVDENTPLQIGNILYSCTPENLITALDGDSGKPIWKFDPHAKSDEHVSCRGVGYYDMDNDDSLSAEAKASYTSLQQCRQRILVSSVDARLFALDAHTGSLCSNFGDAGYVDLKKGMGPTQLSKRYHPTSLPVVMGHLAVVGGWVRDLIEEEPSGVVRAFDVITGKLVWAWDVGTSIPMAIGTTGYKYELGTPNVWSIPTYDKEFNQLYLPTGNGTPDYWGGTRNDVNEKFGSSIVAVDAATGKTKWSFQTVHHDVWDYDVPSQPVLYSLKDKHGAKTPVLIQTTKTGNIFVLDRRTGEPVIDVEEREVHTYPAAQGEHLASTQPFSTGMPIIGAKDLDEKFMWGITTFDQLYCRIKFKASSYVGPFTPPTENPYIQWPGFLGGMNWGGVSIDEHTGMMFVNDIRTPVLMRLVTKKEADKQGVSLNSISGSFGSIRAQVAGIYGGVQMDILQSPLGVPCNAPPFGTMSAINLNSKKLVWQVPMGTAKDMGPLNIKTHMDIPIGMPTLGGPTSTASGLVFFAGTQDYYLRALDSSTGKELWKGRLPVGAVAAPLIYESPATGKQYVVISAGGTSHSPDIGDYIIAYSLPDKQ